MNIFLDEHIDILRCLANNNVEYILVGGVAVNFYGFSRPTGDMDIWLKPDVETKQNLIKALIELDMEEDSIRQIQDADFTKALVFHIGSTPPFIIDFLTKIVGVQWGEAWAMKSIHEIEGLNIAILHLNHLMANKLVSGRPKDLEDIRQLTRLNELKKS